jgi:drug/metabolite transporter (DMT)-like permease
MTANPMKRSDAGELVALAALWGASFLFMRMGAAEFGPVALSAVRVVGASLFLLPLLCLRRQASALRRHWKPLLVLGLFNSALPFLCFSFAALSITAGLSAIFNASSPLWGALFAWWWLQDRPTPTRTLGLAIGFAGVLWLAWDKASFKPGGSGWAVVACLAATVCYGLSAAFAKRRLNGVPPLAVAAGSQLAAAVCLVPFALVWWPATSPTATAWSAAGLLAIACTGIAYLLYFRLIANVGPARAIAVTFLIPVFAAVWGWLLLDESLTPTMMAGCVVVLLGTALTTGLIGPSRAAAVAPTR